MAKKIGISRYTLGAYNEPALTDVYDKAKELYADSVTPPSTGLITNSLDLVWDDMNTPAKSKPASTPLWEQFMGPEFLGYLQHNTEWERTNMWIEVEEDCFETETSDVAEFTSHECSLTSNQSINTMVEISPIIGSYLTTSDNWIDLATGTEAGNQWEGHTSPTGGDPLDQTRSCSNPTVVADRNANTSYDPFKGYTYNKGIYVRPDHYYWAHWWSLIVPFTDQATMKAVYVGVYARLVLIDPNGVDDRHLARYLIHCASDSKDASGLTLGGAGAAGISKYKLIPQNGDWMPMNFIDGDITRTEFDTNPPSFITTPYM